MCKVRALHFTLHDTRLKLSTKPFTTPGSLKSGDFISCTTTTTHPSHSHSHSDCCPHAHSTTALLQQHWHDQQLLSNNTEPIHNSTFDACPFGGHACCVVSTQAVPCQWYFDNQDVLGEDRQGAAWYCANRFVVSEYLPIGLIIMEQGDGEDDELEEGEVEDDGPVAGWNGFGELRDELPSFPADEVLYSDEIIEAPASVPESLGLYGDRDEVLRLGEELWRDKEFLGRTISAAQACLDSLERELGNEDLFKLMARDATTLLRWVRLARRLVREVQNAELDVAETFRGMMKHSGFVLSALNRMPGPGQSFTTPDGLYSVSREELDLGQLDTQQVIGACEGPLKQSAILTKRLQAVEEVLKVPKRLKARSHRTVRGGPIHALWGGAKTRKTGKKGKSEESRVESPERLRKTQLR